MYAYASCLRRASFLMANSSWTKAHVDAILGHREYVLDAAFAGPIALMRLVQGRFYRSPKVDIVYPPCDTRAMAAFPLEGREPVVVSVAQFR